MGKLRLGLASGLFLVVTMLLGHHRTMGQESAPILTPPSDDTSPSGDILKQETSYYCDPNFEGRPTVFFRSDLGNAPIFAFDRQSNPEWYEKNPEWTPEERCYEVANRAVEFNNLGIISYLTNEWMEELDVWAICISKVDASHLQLLRIQPDFVRLLVTLKPNDDPDETLEKIKGISSISKSGKPLVL